MINTSGFLVGLGTSGFFLGEKKLVAAAGVFLFVAVLLCVEALGLVVASCLAVMKPEPEFLETLQESVGESASVLGFVIP